MRGQPDDLGEVIQVGWQFANANACASMEFLINVHAKLQQYSDWLP
jgi:hypothetical protein